MRNKDIDIGGLIYTIYDNGEVYRDNRKIKQRPCYNDGYASFTAGKKNSRKSIRTHTIVGKLFVENPNNYPELDHLDGNRMNPSADNLEWVTHEENIKRAYEKGSYDGRIVDIPSLARQQPSSTRIMANPRMTLTEWRTYKMDIAG